MRTILLHLLLLAIPILGMSQSTPTSVNRGAANLTQVDQYLTAAKRLGIPTSPTDNLAATETPQNSAKLLYNTTLNKLRVYNPVTETWRDAIEADLTNYYTKTEIDALLNGKISTSEKGQNNGVAPLDANGKIPPQYVDIPDAPVTSVNGKTGDVVLTKADVGLGNVDNTSDLAKPISTATQTALDGKANTSHTHNASDINAGTLNIARIPTGTTGSTVALGNDSRINNGQTAYDWGDFRDYGLGINPTITNADLITESGFFSTSNAHAFGYGSGIHLGRYEPSGVRAGQLHIENAGSGSEPVVKVRMHNSSGWGTIRTLWHDGNLRSNAQNDARYLQLTGGTVTGVIKSPAPVANEDLANKAYVDASSVWSKVQGGYKISDLPSTGISGFLPGSVIIGSVVDSIGSAGSSSIGIGRNSLPRANYSLALGYGSTTGAQGIYSTSIGRGSYVNSINSTSIGAFNTISGGSSGQNISIGAQNVTTNSAQSTLIGNGLNANPYGLYTGGVILGRFNNLEQQTTSTLFVIGNGTNDANRSNAYILNNNGNSTQYGIASYGADYSAGYTDRSLVDKAYVDSKASPFNLIDVTQQLHTDKAINVNVFNNTGMSYSEGAIDFGVSRSNTHEMGLYAFKQGVETTSSGDISVAFGSQTTASGVASSAFGNGTTASELASSAFGSGTTASGMSSSAFGFVTTASGSYSSAFGFQSIANEYASLAIGQFSTDGSVETSWTTGSPIFKVGNGTSAANRSNAYTLYNDGRSEQIKDVEVTEIGQGFVLKSPDGTRWRITVDNSGNLTATSL